MVAERPTPKAEQPLLELALLGPLGVRRPNGRPIELSSRKGKALLAYLALHSEALPRAQLANLLWEESSEERARNSLRQTLSRLRSELGRAKGVIEADANTVGLAASRVAVDVRSFQSLAQKPSDIGALEHAAGLYRGPFMEGFDARAPNFEPWLMLQRTRLDNLAAGVFERLAGAALASGDWDRGVAHALRILQIDPVRESAHRLLIQLHLARGNRREAVRQFERCRQLLRDELGVKPSRETRELMGQVRGEAPSQVLEPAGAPPEDTSRVAAPDAVPGPRVRQVAVLVAEIASFADLGAGDPERIHLELERFYQRVRVTVARFGGELLAMSGARVSAAFGLERAASDDIERAVHAAEALHAPAVGETSAADHPLRIGIASGRLVVASVPESGLAPPPPTGAVVHWAEELARSAAPGETRRSAEVSLALRSRSFTPSSPLVGRGFELRQLSSALEQCQVERRGCVIRLRGEAGLGKTRLATEVAEYARDRGFRVHHGRVSQLPHGGGDHHVIRKLAAALHADLVEARHAIDQLDLSLIEELAGIGHPDDAAERSDALKTDEREHAQTRALSELLAAMSRRAPYLIWIDDLHWADASTLAQVRKLARRTVDNVIVILITTRPEGRGLLAATAPWSTLTLDLSALSDDEARALIDSQAELESVAVGRAVARGGGNPLFLIQLALSLSQDPRHVPGSVHSIVLAQLDRMTADQRARAQAAAVLGQRAGAEALAAVAERAPSHEWFEGQQLLRRRAGGVEFVHGLVRDAVYDSLAGSERRSLHLRAGSWFESRDPVEAAYHLELAESPAAARACVVAARGELKALRHASARDLLVRARALADQPGLIFEVSCLSGRLQLDLGEGIAARASFEAALELASSADDRVRALLGLAEGLRSTDDLTEGLEVLRRATEAAAGRPAHLARIESLRGQLMFSLGDYEGSLGAQRSALEHARNTGTTADQIAAQSGIADALYARGDIGEAHEHFRACVELARTAGLVRHQPANLAMSALTSIFLLELDRAGDDLAKAFELPLGPRSRIHLSAFRGLLAHERDDIEAMLEHYAQSVATAKALGLTRFEANGLALVALARHDRGEPRAAEIAEQAWTLGGGADNTFAGPIVLAAIVATSGDPRRRAWAIAEGRRMLAEPRVPAHNHIWFHQYALMSAIERGDDELADLLVARWPESGVRGSIPIRDFYLRWAKAILSYRQHGKARSRSLSDVVERAARLGLKRAQRLAEEALSRSAS